MRHKSGKSAGSLSTSSVVAIGLVLVGLFSCLVGQSSRAEVQQARLNVSLAAGVYKGSGGFPDVASRNLAGLHLEFENLWPGTRYSFLMQGQSYFDTESSVLAETVLSLGSAYYLRDPVRPDVLVGRDFLVSQQQFWNARIAAFGGLGRKLLRPFSVGDGLEANTDILVVGLSALMFFPFSPAGSVVFGPNAHYALGIGRYDSTGQTLMFQLGTEFGL